MKKLIIFLFTLVLTISSFSQSDSLDGLNKKEIKQLLTEQEDEKVKKHMKDYTNRKIGGITLLLASVISAFFAKGKSRRLIETADSLSAPVLTASSLSFIIGILLLVTADSSFNKSKEAYLNPVCIQLVLDDQTTLNT